MTGFDWQSVADAVESDVMSLVGGTVTIARSASTSVTPIPGVNVARSSPISSQTGDFSAVLSKSEAKYREGGSVSVGNAKFVVSPGDFEPCKGDTLTSNGKTYEILQVVAVRPDGFTPVVFECMVSI